MTNQEFMLLVESHLKNIHDGAIIDVITPAVIMAYQNFYENTDGLQSNDYLTVMDLAEKALLTNFPEWSSIEQMHVMNALLWRGATCGETNTTKVIFDNKWVVPYADFLLREDTKNIAACLLDNHNFYSFVHHRAIHVPLYRMYESVIKADMDASVDQNDSYRDYVEYLDVACEAFDKSANLTV